MLPISFVRKLCILITVLKIPKTFKYLTKMFNICIVPRARYNEYVKCRKLFLRMKYLPLLIIINNNSVEKNINIQEVFFFSLLKKPGLKNKNKKTIDLNYLIIVLIKMLLLIFLVFSYYELACKYGIIFQVSTYNWMQNYIF